jgi:hypothetical protein
MQYGNCLFGALLLVWTKRKEKPKFVLRFRPESFVPHFMVLTEKELHHYKLDKNIFFWPFCYVLFKGSFQTLDKEKEPLFVNEKAKLNWILSISLLAGIVFAFYFS